MPNVSKCEVGISSRLCDLFLESVDLADNNGISGTPGDPATSVTQSLLNQTGISNKLEDLQKTVEDIHKWLRTRDNSRNTRTVAGRIKNVSRREKEAGEIHEFLDDLSDIKENAKVLCATLSVYVI